MNSEVLALLHDHHKDSYSYIRKREQQRDRLFLIVIAIFGLLATAIFFATSSESVLSSIRVAGSQLDLRVLPPAPLLSMTWVFALAISLRYCQVCIVIERQYSYLHHLESVISEEFGDSLYRRESQAYLDNYPAFSTWAWISYVLVFPLIAFTATLVLLVAEWVRLDSGWTFRILDLISAVSIVATFFLYRIFPLMRTYAQRRSRVDADSSPAEGDKVSDGGEVVGPVFPVHESDLA